MLVLLAERADTRNYTGERPHGRRVLLPMSDRESSQVGYRLRGIEPPDLARYPDPVKLMF